MKVYSWSDVPEERVNPLASRQMIHGEALSIIRRQFSKGAVTKLHKHAEEQISIIETGKLRFVVLGEETVVSSGQTLAIPPNVPHSLEALEDSVVMDLFAIPQK